MIEILSEHAVVLLLVWGLACFGAMIVQERPAGILAWNRAFIVGLSAASVALFPLSLLLPHTALLATLALVCVAAALWLRGLKTSPNIAPSAFAWFTGDPWERAVLLVIVIFVLAFGVTNACFPLGWDGFQIWATKGLVLQHQGSLTAELWPASPNTDITRVVKYPPMVPLFTALLAVVRGAFSWTAAKPLFLAFYVSMLVSIYDAGRRLLPRSLALAAVLIPALIPVEFDTATAGGYADMPQAAVLAAALAATLSAEHGAGVLRSPVLWTLAGLLMVKNEGLILFGIVIVVSGCVLGRRARQLWKLGVGLSGALAIRVAYLWWTNAIDITFGYNLDRAWQRIVPLPGMAVQWMTRWDDWALYWPATLVAAIILLLMGRAVERALAGGLALALAAYTGTYLFTNWDMALHFSNSYQRLLQQLVPVASLTLAAAYGRLARTRAEGIVEASPPRGRAGAAAS